MKELKPRMKDLCDLLTAMAALMADARFAVDSGKLSKLEAETLSDSIDRAEKTFAIFTEDFHELT